MIHRYFSWPGRQALCSALMSAVLFSNNGWAFHAAALPRGDDLRLVADSSCPSSANETATTTLDVFCRAAKQAVSPVSPHCPLPAEPFPAEKALSAADANDVLRVIGHLANDQTTLCSRDETTPDSILNVVSTLANANLQLLPDRTLVDPNITIGDVDPVSHHHRLPSIVPTEEFVQTSSSVRDVYGQVKASLTQKK